MTIGCRVSGYGPIRVLFIHGWLSDLGVYDLIAPMFDEAQFTCAFMDFRGYGKSRGLSGDYSINEIAKDALELADTLGWDNFQIVGHSMGGMVLQKMAVLSPGRLSQGIAVAPVPASGFTIDEDTRNFFQSAADSDEALTEIFNILTGKRHSKAFLSGLTARARSSTATQPFLGYLKAWTETDFASEVNSLDVPVLVISGAKDGALGPEVMQDTYLKQLPNARMETIEAAGHYPMLETPVELFTLLEKALSK